MMVCVPWNLAGLGALPASVQKNIKAEIVNCTHFVKMMVDAKMVQLAVLKRLKLSNISTFKKLIKFFFKNEVICDCDVGFVGEKCEKRKSNLIP